MQVSTRTEDFIVDTLELWKHMHTLSGVFANPRIVKVTETESPKFEYSSLHPSYGRFYMVQIWMSNGYSVTLGCIL